MAFAGLAERLGWLTLPGPLQSLADPIVIGVAGALTLLEVLASLVPGIATAWEAVHTAIRPAAAGALAALAAWGATPRVVVLAALLVVADQVPRRVNPGEIARTRPLCSHAATATREVILRLISTGSSANC